MLETEENAMEAKVYNYAVMLLSRREHSVRELSSKIRRKWQLEAGYSDAVLLVVVTRLEASGYLSDERFARAYGQARKRKGFGVERIRYELSEKGVASETLELVLAELAPEWQDAIYGVWEKKFNKIPLDYRELAKQQKFLRYRGFCFQEIEELYKKLGTCL